MFTEREQEELVNSVLHLPNNIHLSAVPQVPDVPHVPKVVWHLPINIFRSPSGKFL
jgi:hypothetical protein